MHVCGIMFGLKEIETHNTLSGEKGRGGISVCGAAWGLYNLGEREVQEATKRKQCDMEALKRKI